MLKGLLNRVFGDAGERAAASHLRAKGYRILARQYTNSFGEIDLIAMDGDTIVFVEVKTRRSTIAGHPVEAVGDQKQRQLTRVALAYLKRYGLLNRRARFDIVAIIWPDSDVPPDITHYVNAFEPSDKGQLYS